MRFWKCALRYWFLTSWTCLHENITGTWVFLDVQKLFELISLRGKRDASVSKNLEAELCLFWNSDVGYENVIKFTIHYVQCCHQSFFFSVPLETNDICKKIWNPVGYGISPGMVQRANESFYYDAASKSCKPFRSLGCLGNANNFVSEHSCKVKCTRE